MLRKICGVQIQPRKHVLDNEDYMTTTRQPELDHTDHTDQGSINITALKDLDNRM